MVNNSKEYMKKNYKKYRGNKSAIADRVKRNQARANFEDKGIVHKGDGKEVDHKKGVHYGNGDGNLQVLARLKNRQKGQKKAMKHRTHNYDV
jgi:hypothetical protein